MNNIRKAQAKLDFLSSLLLVLVQLLIQDNALLSFNIPISFWRHWAELSFF